MFTPKEGGGFQLPETQVVYEDRTDGDHTGLGNPIRKNKLSSEIDVILEKRRRKEREVNKQRQNE